MAGNRRLIILLLGISLMGLLQAAAKEPVRGYRGFVDLNAEALFHKKYAHGAHDIVYSVSGITTTHGYQFNEHFFAGGGTGICVATTNYDWFALGLVCPIFVTGRADWNVGKVPLFADLRLGSYLNVLTDNVDIILCGTNDKFYVNPSVGYHWSWGRKVSLNIGAGVSMHWYDSGYGYRSKFMPTVKIGIEFN